VRKVQLHLSLLTAACRTLVRWRQIGYRERKEIQVDSPAFDKRSRNSLDKVDETEQPFSRTHNLLQDVRRHRGANVEPRMLIASNVATTPFSRISSILNGTRYPNSSRGIQIDLSINRKECKALAAESCARNQPGNVKGAALLGSISWT
jgi:hypothetical protein